MISCEIISKWLCYVAAIPPSSGASWLSIPAELLQLPSLEHNAVFEAAPRKLSIVGKLLINGTPFKWHPGHVPLGHTIATLWSTFLAWPLSKSQNCCCLSRTASLSPNSPPTLPFPAQEQETFLSLDLFCLVPLDKGTARWIPWQCQSQTVHNLLSKLGAVEGVEVISNCCNDPRPHLLLQFLSLLPDAGSTATTVSKIMEA